MLDQQNTVSLQIITTMCENAEVRAKECGHLYDLDIRRCREAIQAGTTCPPPLERVRYPDEDHDGKCKACEGQSPPDSTWYVSRLECQLQLAQELTAM